MDVNLADSTFWKQNKGEELDPRHIGEIYVFEFADKSGFGDPE